MMRSLQRRFVVAAMCAIFLVLSAIMSFIMIGYYHQLVGRADELCQILAENGGKFPEENFSNIMGHRSGGQPPQDDAPEDMQASSQTEATAATPAATPGATPASSPAATPGATPASSPAATPAATPLPNGERYNGGGSKQNMSGGLNFVGLFRGNLWTEETQYAARFFSVIFDENGSVSETYTDKVATIDNDEAVEYAQSVYESKKARGFYKKYRFRKMETEDGEVLVFLDAARELNSFYNIFEIVIIVSLIGLGLIFVLVVIFSKIVCRPIAESHEKQKQFITDASHELKTPLTIIEANTEVLEMVDGENEWTESIRRQVKRLTTLTRQMVSLSRMDEGRNNSAFSEIHYTDLILEETEPFRLLAETKGKKLNIQADDNLICCGDEQLLRQMVSLLMDNAIKYSDSEGNILLSVHKKGKKIQLQISNTVEEISQGNQDILFERFYRTDASRNSETGGSGIGLSVVKAIVLTHRGKIHACSKDGKSLDISAIW